MTINCTTKDMQEVESDFEININAAYESLREIFVFFKADNTTDLAYRYLILKDFKANMDGTTNQLFTFVFSHN